MTSRDNQTRERSNAILGGVDSSSNDFPSEDEKLNDANELYEKAKRLSEETDSPDEHVAKLIIESADDAIKVFGTTNQGKKVELRKIKEKAEKSLPPDTIESLKKRAEGELLQRVYPRQRTVRRLLLLVVAIAVLVIPLVLAIREGRKNPPPLITTSGTKEMDTREGSQASEVPKQLTPRDQAQQTEKRTVDSSSTQAAKPLATYIQGAHRLYRQGQYQAALTECDKALRIEPQNREVLRLKNQIKRTLEILN